MKQSASPAPEQRRALSLLLAVASCILTLHAQTPTGSPPELMSYQGFLADGSGTALASDRPRNYDVAFRIYDASSGGNRVYSERQTVTVDKGYFSVLLGQGTAISGEPNPATFSAIFATNTASDRYIGLAVAGLGAGGSDLVIEPRLRLLPSAYAFLARNANAIANNNGTQILTTSGNTTVAINRPSPNISFALDVNGNVNATGFTGSGAGLTALNWSSLTGGSQTAAQVPSLDAAKITTGTFSVDRIPTMDAAKIGAGTLADARLSANVATLSGSQTFSGAKTFSGGLTMSSDLTANQGLILNGSSASMSLNERPIRIRGGSDANHQLAYCGYYAGGNFGSSSVDGPVLSGWAGGILGYNDPVARPALKWSGLGTEVFGRAASADTTIAAWGLAQQLLVRPRDLWETSPKGNRLALGMAHVHNFEYAGIIQAYAGQAVEDTGPTTLRLNPLGGTVYANTSQISDRNVKQNFAPVDFKAVLAKVAELPVTTWAYTNSARITHMGPIAQDFSAAFGLGDDDKAIAVTDINGVALAAIKGLNSVVQEKEAEIRDLRRELQDLRALVEGLARKSKADGQ